jgi:hypothetical protein
MKLRLLFKTRQPQTVHRVRQVEMSEVELQLMLNQLVLGDDDLRPTARELLDYLDGRGEFATFVDVAARHEEVRGLFALIAERAYYSEHRCPVQHHGMVEGDEEDFAYHNARCEAG